MSLKRSFAATILTLLMLALVAMTAAMPTYGATSQTPANVQMGLRVDAPDPTGVLADAFALLTNEVAFANTARVDGPLMQPMTATLITDNDLLIPGYRDPAPERLDKHWRNGQQLETKNNLGKRGMNTRNRPGTATGEMRLNS